MWLRGLNGNEKVFTLRNAGTVICEIYSLIDNRFSDKYISMRRVTPYQIVAIFFKAKQNLAAVLKSHAIEHAISCT